MGRQIAAALAVAIVGCAAGAQEETLTTPEFVARVSTAIRTAHELSLDASAAMARGRPLPEAVLQARLRQLTRDLDRLSDRTVATDAGAGIRCDTSWLEFRLYPLSSESGTEALKAEAEAIENCLRTLRTEAESIARAPAEDRREHLELLAERRAILVDILKRPEFLLDGESPSGQSWVDRLAAFVERLLRLDFPGWATRGSEVLVALMLGAGVWVVLRFLGRRRPSEAEPIRSSDEEDEAALPVEDASVCAGAKGDESAAVGWACRRLLGEVARQHGPSRWTSRTNGELLARWRGTLAPEPATALEEMVRFHANIRYGGGSAEHSSVRLERILRAAGLDPRGRRGTE